MSLHDRIAVQIAEQENDCEDATEDREHCIEREREREKERESHCLLGLRINDLCGGEQELRPT